MKLDMIRNNINKVLVALVMAFLSSAVGRAEQPDTVSAFNALDYLLQRPAPSRTFDNKRFGDHFSVGFDAGPQWNHKSNTQVGAYGVSPRFGVNVADWFTPVHGLRLSAATGWSRVANDHKLGFGSLALDYMMNFSTLVAGDNPGRKVEMFGVAGVEGQLLYRSSRWTKAAGARLGLQLRYNFTPSTFFYVEPRFGLFNDGIDRASTWQRYDWQAMVMFGFGYRIVPTRYRPRYNGTFDSDGFRQNMFYGIGGGLMAVGNKHYFSHEKDFTGFNGSAFIGKMFTAASGLRFQAQAGYAGRGVELPHSRKGVVVGDVAYVLNLNSAMNGYDPRRRVELNLMAGPSLAFPTSHNGHPYLGFGGGVQGVWNVSDEWGLFIEPYARAFSRQFAWEDNRRVNLLASLNIGVRYRINGYKSKAGVFNTNANYEDYLDSRRFFMGAGGGVASRGAYSDIKLFDNTVAGSLFVGKWFSPESAWRVGVNYDYCGRRNSTFMELGLSADYMLNLSNLTCGWNAERVISVSPLVGFEGGIAHYRGKNHGVVGVKAGLNAQFNVSRTIGIFIEPQAVATHLPGYNDQRMTPGVRLLGGVVYRLGNVGDAKSNRGFLGESQRNYVSIAGGPGLFSETMFHTKSRRATGAADVAVGHWFSHNSALQAGVSFDAVPLKSAKNAYVTTIHADYLLDISQAMAPDPERCFSVMGKVGCGLAFSNHVGDDFGVSVEGGLRFNWRASRAIDIFMDPTMTLWQPKLIKVGYGNNSHHYVGTGRLLVGAGWRF